ncbi:MAG TPA: TIM barrel protein [Spirochaetia bacterium]|nr:TIM barrel protein [Spirochaetales bacterium]HRY79521.1 TIM barrel protein [Spirochaetia bacterium]HRZ89047.1 TIM barrel protein [Spirochaetia bacterium]
MKLGISSYAYAWTIGVPGFPGGGMDAFGFLRRCADKGVRAVQIADNLPVHGMDAARRRELRSLAEGLGVEIQLGMRGCAVPDLRAYLALCEEFGSPLLRVVLDTRTDRPDAAEAVRRLREVARDFERAGVDLSVENHDRFRARDLAALVRGAESSAVGICLDSVNSFGAAEGTQTVLEELIPLTTCLHVKDFTIARHPHNMGFSLTGVPAGRGFLDVPDILARLATAGRDPDAFLELWPSPEQTPAETEAKEEAWVGESAAYLRTLIRD